MGIAGDMDFLSVASLQRKEFGSFQKSDFKTTDCGQQTTEGERKGEVTNSH